MLIYLKIIIFFILLIIPFQANCDIKPSEIHIYNQPVRKIPSSHSFVGVNWIEDSEYNRNFFKNPSQLKELGTLLKSINVDSIRYPGGLNATFNFWDVPYEKSLAAHRNLPKFEQVYLTRWTLKPNDRLSFFEFMRFCQNNDIKTTIQVNTHTIFDKKNNEIKFIKPHEYNSEGKRIKKSGKISWELVQEAAESAAQQVRWVKENGYAPNAAYWELGNEEYAHNHFLNTGYTGDEYAKVAAIFIREMRKVDPSIKFIVTFLDPAKAERYNPYLKKYFENWYTEFINNQELKAYRDHIFAFSAHIYGYITKFPESIDFPQFKEAAINNEKLNAGYALSRLKSLFEEAGYDKPQIFMNEFNTNNFKNKYKHTWLDALTLAKMIMSAANNPYCYHCDYHALIHFYKDVSLGFGLVHYAKDFSKMHFIKYPSAYVMEMLNENIKGDVLKTFFDDKEICVITVIDKGRIKVNILNLGQDKTIVLKNKGFEGLKYINNKSLGINIPLDLTVMREKDSMKNPSEIKLLNILDNEIKVKHDNNDYLIALPANTLAVFYLKNY